MKFLILFFLMTPIKSFSSESVESVYLKMEKQKDFLGIRVLLKKRFSIIKQDYKEWKAVDSIIYRNPQVGLDLLRNWHRFKPTGYIPSFKEQRVNAAIRNADELMSAESFEKASAWYQKLSLGLKSLSKRSAKQSFLYFNMLQQTARAFYGAKKFTEALEIYTWFPISYPMYQQILFEKMWAAIRSGRFDLANGAIASMNSSYYSKYMMPEAYLVQAYVYKRLCREKDFDAALVSAENYLNTLSKNEQIFSEWAKSSMENFNLYRLSRQQVLSEKEDWVSLAERAKEQQTLTEILMKRLGRQKKSLKKNLESMVKLAKNTSKKSLDQLPEFENPTMGYKVLLKNGYEMWPVEDTEEWLDELGMHRYMGQNNCKEEDKEAFGKASGSGLYLRENFNDFHNVEKVKRKLFAE